LNRVTKALPLLCMAVACVGLVVVAALAREWVHPDCAMYLYTGELILDGQVPYVDFVEVNPPLVMYVSVIPVAIARLLGVAPIVVFNVLVSLLAVWGALALVRYLPRVLPQLGEPHRHVCAVSWLAFSFWVLIGGPRLGLPTGAIGSDYGQREHLLVLGFLPMLLLRWSRWEEPRLRIGTVEAVATGAVAGLVCALKPMFVLVPVVVELHGLVARHRRRALRAPEIIAACAVGVAYAAHLAFVPASMRAAFLHRWLPLALERYQAYGATWDELAALPSVRVAAILLIAFVLPWGERYRRMLRSIYPLASLCLGGVVAMLAQKKGWYYHVIPIHAAVWMTVTLVVVQILEDQQERSAAPKSGLARIQRAIVAWRPTALAVLLLAWPALLSVRARAMFRQYRSPTLDFVRAHSAAGDAVLYLHTSVPPPSPELLLGPRLPGSRYLWTFPVAYLCAGADPDARRVPPEREQEAADLVAELASDVRARRPAVILVWRGANAFCPAAFSLPDLLSEHDFETTALVGYERVEGPQGWFAYVRGSDPDALPEPISPRPQRFRPDAALKRPRE
jgi:hypothetical protein